MGPFAVLPQQYRQSAGLSQEELAERAGLSARGISDLERGVRRAPYPTTVRLLAQALGLSHAEQAALLAASRQGTATAGAPASVRQKSTLPVRLSSKERADSIRALADSGGGVREICRWTGKDAGTISRWLRIGHKPVVMEALEEGRIDIARAQYLAPRSG